MLRKDGGAPNSDCRKRALDDLRLVIHLEPQMIKGYEVLAKELLYGDINDVSNVDKKKMDLLQYKSNNSIRRRQGLMQQLDNTSSPELLECKETLRKGLSIDPTNSSLLKLQSELNLVMKYGRNNTQTRMMNVGSFGWSCAN